MEAFRTEPSGNQQGRCQGLFYVGDSAYPAELDLVDVRAADGKVLHRTRRARLLSETPQELSIVWGEATWSTNRDCGSWNAHPFQEEPTHVEAAAVVPGAGVIGEPWNYLTVPQVRTLVKALAAGTLSDYVDQEVPETEPGT